MKKYMIQVPSGFTIEEMRKLGNGIRDFCTNDEYNIILFPPGVKVIIIETRGEPMEESPEESNGELV